MAAKKSTRKTKAAKSTKKSTAKKTVNSSSKANDNLKKVENNLKSLKKKRYFPFLIVLLVLLIIGYFGRKYLFVAIVDGKPISRIQVISELEKQGGQQALDSLVTKELVNQEAKRKGVNVTKDDIDSEIQRISEMIEAQGTTLEAALAMQGQTIEDLNENIKLQKTVEKLLADSIQVTDEDLMNYFEENKEYYGEDVKFDDIKDSIKDQLTQEKLSSEFQTLLQKLKDEGNIIYIVDYQK